MLFVELYTSGYKTSAGNLDGWELRFFIAESKAAVNDKFQDGDYVDSWPLDDEYDDIDDREDLEWWDQQGAGSGTWFIADADGTADVPFSGIIDAFLSGQKIVPSPVKDALTASSGCFRALDSGPWAWT